MQPHVLDRWVDLLQAWSQRPPRMIERHYGVITALTAKGVFAQLDGNTNGAPCGPFPDSTLAVCLSRGDMPMSEATSDAVLSAHTKDDPRQVCRRLFLKSLLKYEAFAADRDRALDG